MWKGGQGERSKGTEKKNKAREREQGKNSVRVEGNYFI